MAHVSDRKNKAGDDYKDILKVINASRGLATPDPNAKVEVIGGISPIGNGERNWMEIDLPPGNYTLICPLPDLTTMGKGEPMMHVQEGMLKTIVVK